MVKIYSVPQRGDMNADVGTLQQALLDKGIQVRGGKDLIFGTGTQDAIIEFQKQNGLIPDKPGNLGPKTLSLLGIEVIAITPSSGNESVTKDLKAKQNRHIHPAIRIQIEAHLFPERVVPKCFVDGDIQQCKIAADLALAKVGIQEKGGNNMGTEVGEVQSTTGSLTPGGNGDAWCLDYQQITIAIIEDYFGIESPILGIAHCVTCFNAALKVPGLVSMYFEEGTLALGRHGTSSDGHAMGAVKSLSEDTMQTNEGNTSISSMTDGDGSGLKVRNKKKNGDLITMGFVRVYPYNQLPKV